MNGAGPYLDDEWDFEVDNTGDILCTNQLGYDIAELEKDLAYAVASRLSLELGAPIRSTTKASFESITRSTILQDPRIAEITNLDITEISTDKEGYVVEVTVSGTDEQITEPLIFRV